MHAFAYFAWFCVLLSTSLPAPVQGDLCKSPDDESERREKVAYVVAGLTVIGVAAGIACLATASGHHHHHSRSSWMSSVDNYRPYSSGYHHHHHHSSDHSDYSSDDSSDHHHHHHHHHHHSGYYSSNPYSIFSENNASSWSGGSDSSRSERRTILRGRTCHAASSKHAEGEESALSGQFIAHSSPSADAQGSVTAFVQLPDGSSRSLGTIPLSGNGSLSYGPFLKKGTYTFGVSLDQGSGAAAQKIGTIQIEMNGAAVKSHDFTAPPHAPASYEPAPCIFDLN